MFYKTLFLPILILFTGCLDAPFNTQIAPSSTQTETPSDNQPAPGKKATRPESLVSIFRSDDLGRSWMPMGDGLPEDLSVTHLDTLGKQIVLASRNYGVYLSDPQRKTWRQLDTSTLPSYNINSLHVSKGSIYVGVLMQGVYVSNDSGKSWTSLNHNLKDETAKSILRTENKLLIGTDDGIYALEDGSETWQRLSDIPQFYGLLKVGDHLVASTYDGIALSSDKGKTWEVANSRIRASNIVHMDGKIIAMDVEEVVSVSEDKGKTWRPIKEFKGDNIHVFDVVKVGNELLRSQSNGIYLSKDGGEKWKDIYHFSFDEPYGVMLSSGEQWNEVYSRPEVPIMEFIVVDGVVYGATVRGC